MKVSGDLFIIKLNYLFKYEQEMIPDSFTKIINDVFRLNDSSSPDNLNDLLKKIAIDSPRKQSRICLHKEDSESLQLMYICHLKNCKVRIHKHLDFPEWIIFLKGKSQIIYFSDEGEELATFTIDTKKGNSPIMRLIPKQQYHTLRFDEDSYFLEIKQGPFKKNSTIYYK